MSRFDVDPETRFAMDSPPEEGGFEPSVPGGKWGWTATGGLTRLNPDDAPGFCADSAPKGAGFELVWGFSCQVVIFGLLQFFVRSGKAVLHPVVYDQVRGARGRGQGTETLAKLGGLPLSGACVSQRLDA